MRRTTVLHEMQSAGAIDAMLNGTCLSKMIIYHTPVAAAIRSLDAQLQCSTCHLQQIAALHGNHGFRLSHVCRQIAGGEVR